MVVFWLKLLCSGKSGSVWANVVVFLQGECIWAKCLCSCKVVIFGQVGCIREKVVVIGQNLLYLGKRGCIRVKVVVIGKKLLFSDKMGIFGQKRWYSGKVVVFAQKWLYS